MKQSYRFVHSSRTVGVGCVHEIAWTINVSNKRVTINDASRAPKPRLLSFDILVLEISPETPSSLIMVQMDSEVENNTFWHTVAEIFY